MACRLAGAKPLPEPMLDYCSIGPLGTNFNEISFGIQTFSFKKMHLKMSSGKWRPSCRGLNVTSENHYGFRHVDPGGLVETGEDESTEKLQTQIIV